MKLLFNQKLGVKVLKINVLSGLQQVENTGFHFLGSFQQMLAPWERTGPPCRTLKIPLRIKKEKVLSAKMLFLMCNIHLLNLKYTKNIALKNTDSSKIYIVP